jgi:hypothetical protein
MQRLLYVPRSLRHAGKELRSAFRAEATGLSSRDFVRAWSAISYLFPGLHPDGYDHPDSGWPRVLKPFAAEAWRRADSGQLSDEELYPCGAQWSGLFDRMRLHLPEETERRVALAAACGE